jgi:hypothetical protein
MCRKTSGFRALTRARRRWRLPRSVSFAAGRLLERRYGRTSPREYPDRRTRVRKFPTPPILGSVAVKGGFARKPTAED